MAKDLHCLPSSRVFGRDAVVLVQVLSRDLAISNWVQLDSTDGCDVETRTVSAKVPNLGKRLTCLTCLTFLETYPLVMSK